MRAGEKLTLGWTHGFGWTLMDDFTIILFPLKSERNLLCRSLETSIQLLKNIKNNILMTGLEGEVATKRALTFIDLQNFQFDST